MRTSVQVVYAKLWMSESNGRGVVTYTAGTEVVLMHVPGPFLRQLRKVIGLLRAVSALPKLPLGCGMSSD
jgi:hypothetical protein